VRVDGQTYRTEVSGTLADVVAGRPLAWRSCDGPVRLDAGDHRIVAEQTAQFQPVTLALRPEGGDDGAARRGQAPRMRIGTWGDERRVVSVSAGPAAVLRIPENVNEGWRATLDGERLEPVVLDGWQQGYRIPAGRGGDVVLEFAPGTWYRSTLLAGLVLAVFLVVLVPFTRRSAPRRAGVPVGLTTAPRVLGTPGAVAVGLGALVLGGIPLALGWVAGLVGPIRRYAVPLGVLAVVSSGVLVAMSAGLAMGRPGAVADTAAAVGVGLLLGQLVRVRSARDGASRGEPDG
jgi:arabinofuranan 3-O-arabinosyltransferase